MAEVDEKPIAVAEIETSIPHVDPELLKMHGESTKEVRNAHLYAALQQTNIPRWSKQSIHLYLAILVAFFSSCANGYDGSLMTAILAMPHFQETFDTNSRASRVSVLFSIYTVGAMVAAPIGAPLSDRYGRRKTMFVGAIVVIIGMVIAVTSKAYAQYAVSRLILGGGVVIMTVAAPAYCIEISPPHWRGRATGLYNVGWFGGSIPAAAITFGTNYINSNRSWQLPLIFQAWACGFVIILVWFLPESPRWLMQRGREQEALEFLIKYHGNGDPDSALVALEYQEMREGIALDGADKRWWDYRAFLYSHSGRWRIAQVAMISTFGQFTSGGLGYFNTLIYGLLGVTSVPKQLAYNLLSSVLSCVGAVSGSALTDRMFRRPVLITGTAICCVLLAINAGLADLLAKQQSEGQVGLKSGQGALAAYFLFGVAYSFSYTPLQTVLPAESLENTTRAKGLACCQFLNNAASFINAYAGPIGLARLKENYIWVFVGWDVIEVILWYFFLVESQGRTLEELEEIYSQPYPVTASKHKEKVLLDAGGHVQAQIEV